MKTSQKLPKSFVGDFTFDLHSEQHRQRLFLPRNMKRILVHHESYRVRETNGANKGPLLTNGHYDSSFLGSGQRTASQTRRSLSKYGLDGSTSLNGSNNGNLANGVNPHDEDSQPPESVTSKHWLKQVSKSSLVVTGESEKHDTAGRRSRRNQIDPFQDKGAALTLHPLSIRKKLNFNTNKPQEEHSGDERPRKRVRRDAVECLCHVTIWDNREGTSELEALAKRSQTCYLTTREGLAGSVVVDLEITKPIVIKVAELEVAINQKGKQSLGIGDKYFLEIKIIPCKTETQWPPVPVLSKSEGELFAGRGSLSLEAIQGALVARYMHLPQAPASDIPLSVFFVQGGRAYKTKYGLQVNAEWGKPTTTLMRIKDEVDEEPLNFAPWQLDEGGAPFGRRLSSDSGRTRRSSRRSLRKIDSTVEVSYIFDPKSKETSKESRKATLTGFRCPACRIGEFEALSELQFHLINSHHKYKFDLDAEERDPTSGELKNVIFNVNSADVRKPREFKDIKSEWEWNWEAPKKPFDLDAFVKGDHSWVGAQVKKPRNPAAQVLSSDPVMAQRQKNGGFLPVDLVQELPQPKRKKYPVVALNTQVKTASYSSISHRQLRLSEEPVSDTDDEIDSSFAKEKHFRTIEEENGIDSARTKFRKPWDGWRMDEGDVTGAGGASSRFFSDSLVRFVKRNTATVALSIAGPEILTEFARFVQIPREKRELDDGIVRDVMQRIQEYKGHQQPTVNGAQHGHVSADIEMADAGSHDRHPSQSLLAARTRKLLSLHPSCCGKCEEDIGSVTRGMVQCAHEECEAAGVMYHLACAGLKERDPDWICALCKERVGEAEERTREKGKGRAES